MTRMMSEFRHVAPYEVSTTRQGQRGSTKLGKVHEESECRFVREWEGHAHQEVSAPLPDAAIVENACVVQTCGGMCPPTYFSCNNASNRKPGGRALLLLWEAL